MNALRKIVIAVVSLTAICAFLVLSQKPAGATREPDARLATAPNVATSTVVPRANGEVSTLASFGSTLYVGGSFTKLGRPTSHFAVIGRTSPPVLGGPVTAVASDGSGGWFVGGDFRTVGGIPCPRLARVRADGALDRRWCVAPDSEVWELTVTRSRLYVGGEFARIAGRSRSAAAAFDLASAELLPWHPRFRTSGCGGGEEEAPGGAMIEQLAATRSTVFVGGCFHTVGGRPRHNFAAVDAATGAPKRWKPRLGDATGSWALAPSGDTVFLVALWLEPPQEGSHDEVVRQRLVAVDARTGAVRRRYPTPNGWFAGPYPNGGFSIDVSSSTIYLSGEFTRVGAVRRRNLAAIDARSGAVTPWRPDPDRPVDLAVPRRGRVYVAGGFTRIGGGRRKGLAAVDTRTGRATGWMPTWRGEGVSDIAVSGRARVALGLEGGIRGVARNGLAAIETSSGRTSRWNPRIGGGSVAAVAVSGTTLFIAGRFKRVGVHRRSGLAAIDARDHRVLPWNPRTDGDWGGMAVSGGVVYVTREFYRSRTTLISAIDARTGRTRWSRRIPEFLIGPWPIAAAGSTVFVAGGVRLAVLDGRTGRAKEFRARVAGYLVDALAATRDLLYVGLSRGLVVVDAATGEQRWSTRSDAAVTAMDIHRGVLYVGGYFDHIAGQQRALLAAFDAESGRLEGWRGLGIEGHMSGIDAMHVVGSRLYVGGGLDGHLASLPIAAADE